MGSDWVDGLKVAELKAELKKRGLTVSGKKAELAERLIAHLENEQKDSDAAIPSEAEATQRENAEVHPPANARPEHEEATAPATTNTPQSETAGAMEVDAPQGQAADGNIDEPAKPSDILPEGPRSAGEHSADQHAMDQTNRTSGFGLIPSSAANNTAPPPQPRASQGAEGQTKAPIRRQEVPAQRKNAGKSGISRLGGALTLSELSKDPLMQLAQETWSVTAQASGAAPAFDSSLVQRIYDVELGGKTGKSPASRRLTLLELSQYLERYLWLGFDPAIASRAHVMSIVLLVNEKYKEGVPAWDTIAKNREDFKAFFKRFLALRDEGNVTQSERLAVLLFLTNAFQSLENEVVRGEVLRLVGLPLWHSLSPGRLQLELHAHPHLIRHWKSLAKKEAKAAAAATPESPHVPIQSRPEATYLPFLVKDFLERLATAVSDVDSSVDGAAVQYCERFVSFFMELLSQLPTRRFTHAVVEDKAVAIKCYMSTLYRHPAGKLFAQLVDSLRSILSFPIDDHTGDALNEDTMVAAHYEKVQQLQRLLFKHWPKLHEAAMASCGTLQKRDSLTAFLSQLAPEELKALVTRQLRLVDESETAAMNPAFLAEVMIAAYERRRPLRESVDAMPLYPTESALLDEDAVPGSDINAASGDVVLALPRLNLQFLTLTDYLMRNFDLFRLEAAYDVREDVAEAVKRVNPYLADDDSVKFAGWSRMAHPMERFAIIEVQQPKIGESRPGAVTAEIVIETAGMRPEIQAEWNELKQHDVLFVLSLKPTSPQGHVDFHRERSALALRAAGLQHIRGCEIIEIRDQANKLMNDFTGRVLPDERGPPQGTLRTLTVALDPAQYAADAAALSGGSIDSKYGSFNLILRRKAKENNFKAVLESIRDLVADAESAAAMPAWLHDVILGYGDPAAARYDHMDDACLQTVDFKDTFLDAEHLREAFPDHDVTFDVDTPKPPFKVTFPPFAREEAASPNKPPKGKRKAEQAELVTENGSAQHSGNPTLTVKSYTPPDPGPYPEDTPPLNTVRFTQVQASAILSGVQPGLTMVVGPPGTGKTDTAVQILHLLYHNYPSQRTLIITHSNQALNDLFQKIVERDVPPRYLLRLGMGEAELDTEETFSRVGRVNAMLARRMELLADVQRLARSLKVGENMQYTCESASYFWLLHVLSRWEKFAAAAKAQRTADCVAELFPFADFFADAPQPLFAKESFETDWACALGCLRHLQRLFQELEEVRPFEILKTQADRVNYLLTKQAKIIAMTCTHAALKRREFLELGFTYDNLLMEEAAQVLEIETALPMLLQKAEDGKSRLKRVVLIGDHHQLPPVVKNSALQRFSRMDQSLFARFIRLGTPYIELDAQGRARPSLAALYNWRYRALGNLPAVVTGTTFLSANPGFAFDYQLIDVPDFLGRGETEPVQYFYQNLGEAEYVVSVYQYMRLLGYPANKISILTTYNGQRALLQDVIERRCAAHPAFGRPRIVATVDKYQGQQNDYVLLSLVRTKHFGHLRDVRRLVVAMSRARLGLYVFARAGLFTNCYELQPTFKQLLNRPVQLGLVAGERYGETERQAGAEVQYLLSDGVEHMASIVQSMGSEWTAAMQVEPRAVE